MTSINRIIKSQQFKNGIWLYILQFFQIVIPLMTFPYVTRVLGASSYGDFSVALVVVTYIQIIVEYGFNYSGTRKMALSDVYTYSEIYSNIFFAKAILSVISIVIVIILFSVSGYSEMQKACIICLSGIIIGSLLQQTWVFQGLQQMKYITITNVIARIISVILIFLCVRDADDVLIYCILYASTNIISGCMSIIICKKQFGLRVRFCGIKRICDEIKDGFSLFLTSAMAKVVASIGTLFLGLYASSFDIGVYSAIQKIPNIMVMCYVPIGQVIFPHISKLFIDNKVAAQKLTKILCGPVMGLVVAVCVVVGALAKTIILLLCGNEYLDGIKYIYVLLVWIVFSILNNILGSLVLVASGRSREYSFCFGVSALVTIILNYILAIKYSCMGVAVATLTSEVLLTVMMVIYIYKHLRQIF